MKMHPRRSHALLLALAALAGAASAADSDTPDKTSSSASSVVTPCVATATSGSFYDLRPDRAVPLTDGEKVPKGLPTQDYVARGWDYGTNFTLNICGAVVGKVHDFEGVTSDMRKNVSAFYEKKNKFFSLG
jgi:cation-dependent mannose-6-phosphate receptor